jgi:ornithine cyclodeaminase
MGEGDLLVLRGHDVAALLEGQEHAVIEAVRRAYEAHANGDSALPHSTFLRFPASPDNRIIALPAFLGGEFQTAGMKWVASFPGNRSVQLDRASAVIALNALDTGRPWALLEGSIVSAKRTAASAALAARHLHGGAPAVVGLVGAGVINLEVVRFLLAVYPHIERVLVFDIAATRAARFTERCREVFPALVVEIARGVQQVFADARLISFATTAGTPHIESLEGLAPGSTILHVSLRDLAPAVVLACDNVVDDVDHVCRAQTSVHLAEQACGTRAFVRSTLGEVLLGAPGRRTADDTVVFSPFGLGVLDLAVSLLVCRMAAEAGRGSVVSSFLPPSML